MILDVNKKFHYRNKFSFDETIFITNFIHNNCMFFNLNQNINFYEYIRQFEKMIIEKTNYHITHSLMKNENKCTLYIMNDEIEKRNFFDHILKTNKLSAQLKCKIIPKMLFDDVKRTIDIKYEVINCQFD